LFSSKGYNPAAFGFYQVGADGDTPLAGDFDGDGKADLSVYRSSTGEWVIRYSSTGYATPVTYSWGSSTDQPIVRDFDGDGRAELTVFRPSTGQWWVLYSSLGYGGSYRLYHWGVNGDTPVPAR
jgi:hypothetical protein